MAILTPAFSASGRAFFTSAVERSQHCWKVTPSAPRPGFPSPPGIGTPGPTCGPGLTVAGSTTPGTRRHVSAPTVLASAIAVLSAFKPSSRTAWSGDESGFFQWTESMTPWTTTPVSADAFTKSARLMLLGLSISTPANPTFLATASLSAGLPIQSIMWYLIAFLSRGLSAAADADNPAAAMAEEARNSRRVVGIGGLRGVVKRTWSYRGLPPGAPDSAPRQTPPARAAASIRASASR